MLLNGKKSTVDDHVRGPVYSAKKEVYKRKRNGKTQQQMTITSTISISDKDFILQIPTLRQMHLLQIFENYLTQLKLLFENKPVAITMDETTDDCTCSVVNTLFHFRTNTKLVSVDFLIQVNNSTMGSTLLTILTKYNILFFLPRLFISDSATYMKKCFCEVLKPVMPQLIHAPCCAHILNLIG
ncbi:CGG triplet repeat-binding protein 1 [Rhizophagus clarus]|uniref:CGG triplet repeat-binding protein 1 n=1 Tax=Rhizophagus clarus TaxID=94130 RepID=A0A8H3L5Q2_9GLOM|nr:CGG triplet repeat-binding protein 1 [Rhizophagus clarus]